VLGSSSKYAVGRNYYLLLKHNFIETPCSVLHRRSALPKTGVFDKSVNGAEDYELYLRIARHSEFLVHGTTVSEYRLHDSSLSRDAERMMVASYRVLQMERWLTNADMRRKLRLLRTHYFIGFVVVTVSRFLPARLLNSPSFLKRRQTGRNTGRAA
jgi:hypothetical protein